MQRLVGFGAHLAWFLPLAALGAIGLYDKAGVLAGVGAHRLVVACAIAAACGLAVGVACAAASRDVPATRRRATLGAAGSGALLVLVGAGAMAGATAARGSPEDLERATAAAMRDFGGWNGGAIVGGARISAFEIDPSSDLARILLRPYDETLHVVLFSVDDHDGAHDVVVDLDGARLNGDPARAALSHAARSARATRDPGAAEAGVVRVAAGHRLDGASALFAARESFTDVTSITIAVDGAPQEIRGRYFTLEQKRAIDAARGGR